MRHGETKSKTALGFLTVVDHPQYGLCGGYLVLSGCGRPLEFHCTAPIKPNRAQQILYGPTLEPFLYGEQIGQTLILKGKTQPLVVCTDRSPVLALRQYVSVPVALVCDGGEPEADREMADARRPPGFAPQAAASSARVDDAVAALHRLDAPHRGGPALVSFRLGRNRLALPEDAIDDRRLIIERIAAVAESLDLAEPFQRICEAIDEAQRAARQTL
jgi:hypothetical protein